MKTNTLTSAPEPTEAEIQHSAYLLWIENGRPEGRDLENWLTARELLCHRRGRVLKPSRGGARASAAASHNATPKPSTSLS